MIAKEISFSVLYMKYKMLMVFNSLSVALVTYQSTSEYFYKF